MTRVLIIVFDALRPEFVTPELMPNLHHFATQGVWCKDHHSTFPTETRVNQSAVITGCYPHRHGIVANNFPLPGTSQIVRTGDDLAFEKMLGTMTDPLLDAPTLGQILHQNGKTFASISAGTSGGGRLINLDAEALDSFRFTLRRPEASIPPAVPAHIEARIGAIPEYVQPAVAWNQYAVDAWLEYVEPERRPDVSLLWLCEPDESFHWHGIGSPESLDAIGGVDAAFGSILRRKADEIARGDLQVFAMSDHGQVSLDGGKIDLAACAQRAGFSVDEDPADYVISVHNAGGIWVRDRDPSKIAAMEDWLQSQAFCGAVFTRDGQNGTLRHADLNVDHARAPDIYLTLATRGDSNAFGVEGLSADNAPYPDGGGCHGGLSRYELHNVLALGGSAFRKHQENKVPTGNVDILPTVLTLLGIDPPDVIDGRVLQECFVKGPWPSVLKTERNATSGKSGLRWVEYAGTRYFEEGWTVPLHSRIKR